MVSPYYTEFMLHLFMWAGHVHNCSVKVLILYMHMCLFQGPVGPAGQKGEYGFPGRPVSTC